MKNTFVIIALSLMAAPLFAQDPVISDGDKYKVIFENDKVRVLDYKDQPGEKTHEHSHPAFVLYALVPFKRNIMLPNGKILMREFKAGDVLYSDEQTHIGENVGETPTHIIMVEMKSGMSMGVK